MAETRTAFSKVASPRRLAEVYQIRWDILPYLIVVLVLLTVVSIFHVWSRAKVVDLNLRITDVKRQFKEQQQENSRLKLEVASLRMPARIETMAKGELGMALPTNQQVIVVK
jgi:cell division protein FtsL